MELEEGDANYSNGSCFSLPEAHPAALAVHALILSVIAACSVAGNGSVLLLVARFKELRTRSTIVSLCLVLADLLFTLCYTLPAIVTTGKKEWVFRQRGCEAFGFLASDLLITRWLTLSLLCSDRFCTVRFPFSYRRRGKWPMIVLACLAWIVPLVASAVPIQIFTTFELRHNIPICLPTCRTHRLGGLCRLYYAGIFTATFIIGTVIPVILYSWLYHKAKKLRRSVKHKLGHHVVQIANGILVPQPAEQNQTLKETRATITFVLLFLTVVVTGMPGYLLQITCSISITIHCKIPIYVHFVIMEFFLCAPMLTPLVIMRDRAFRASIAKLLFCCGKKTGDLEIQQRGPSKSPSESKSFNNSRRSSILEIPHMKQLCNGRTSVLDIPYEVHEINSSQEESTTSLIHAISKSSESNQEKSITASKPATESSESDSQC